MSTQLARQAPLPLVARPQHAPALDRLSRKAIGFAVDVMKAWSEIAYGLAPPWRGKLRAIDHVTLPCADLAIAEEFYVGVLGARVLMRVDEAFLLRMNRPEDEIEKGVHLSLAFASGPRLDLFRGRVGQPPLLAGHPHMAFRVSPSRMLDWKDKLSSAGVPTDGPRRLGPPGQASMYFNDPFGNHLEIVTSGFTYEVPIGAPDMSRLVYDWGAP